MRLKITLIFLLLSIANLIFAQSNLEKGNEYYKKRAENAIKRIAPTTNINSALSNFEKVFNTSDEEKAAIRYMESIYFKANYCYPEGAKEKKTILVKGKEIGENMVAKHPKSAVIHYWYAVLLGSWAKESGVIAAAKEGVIDKLKSECEAVIKINPNYNNGAGYLFLGILHLDAPYIPFFLTWPDDDKAVELIEKSLKYNPNHISGQYYYAKALNQTGNKENAIEVLNKVTQQQPSNTNYLEDSSELDLCKSLLQDLTK